MKRIVIAIDGFAGCGKSTTARQVAKRLGYTFIDSGAMYRAFTLHLLRLRIAPADLPAVLRELDRVLIECRYDAEKQVNNTLLNGENVTETLRLPEVNELVSEVSAIPQVRHKMVALQQALGREGGVVMDGRDIGTVVFPNAELKIYMSASMEARVLRRTLEYQLKGKPYSPDEIEENLRHRDELDTTRKEGPLRKADDALSLDTSYMTIDEQVDAVTRLAEERIGVKVNG